MPTVAVIGSVNLDIVAKAPNGLTGADVVFPFVSVGATENLLTAAARFEETQGRAHPWLACGRQAA